jgi:hypothetical protein
LPLRAECCSLYNGTSPPENPFELKCQRLPPKIYLIYNVYWQFDVEQDITLSMRHPIRLSCEAMPTGNLAWNKFSPCEAKDCIDELNSAWRRDSVSLVDYSMKKEKKSCRTTKVSNVCLSIGIEY